MDYICKRKNNIQSISITADCTGPRDKEGSQLTPMLLPFPPTLDWKLRPVAGPGEAPPILSGQGSRGLGAGLVPLISPPH